MHTQAQELIERTMAYTLRPTKNDRASVIIEVLDFAIDMEKEEILKLIEELRGIANA